MEPSNQSNSSAEDVAKAVMTLCAAGGTIEMPDTAPIYLTVGETAEWLRVGAKWVRAHLSEFPNSFTLEGRSIRIPRDDVEAAMERWRPITPKTQ
jgi:excisionase family DNA binding protein